MISLSSRIFRGDMALKVSKLTENLFPVLRQVRIDYPGAFRGDLMAAITVTVMLVPQAMAYAMLAGVPPVIGLYAATIPVAVYALIGTSRQMAVGPIAMVSLLVFTGVSHLAEPGTDQYLRMVLTLALMAGFAQLLLGIFRAGWIVNYVSRAVLGGFTSAAAIVIAVSQMSHIVGFQVTRHGNVFNQLLDIAVNRNAVNMPTLYLGIVAIIVLVLLKKLLPKLPGPLLVVIISTVSAWHFGLGELGVELTGDVPEGLPGFTIPDCHWETIKALVPMALTITFISFMESYAVAQSIATREKQIINPDREFAALGLADIAAGLFSGCPVAGGLGRTAVNYAAGARTSLAGLMTAGFMTMTLLFLTPLFYYLPRAVLAAIIISVVSNLFEFKELMHLLRVKVGDGMTFIITFLSTLILGIESGIIVGVLLSLVLFIRRSANPNMVELGYCPDRNAYMNVHRFPMVERYPHVLIIRVDASLYFANAGFVEKRTRKWIEERHDINLVIFDCEGVNDMDAVAVRMLENLVDDYDSRNIDFSFARLKGPVRDILTRAGWSARSPNSIRFRSVRQVIAELGITFEKGFER